MQIIAEFHENELGILWHQGRENRFIKYDT